MTVDCYNQFKESLFLGKINMTTDTIKVALIGTGYAFSKDGNLGLADITAQEIVAANYVTGGATLTNPTVTQDDTNDLAQFNGTDITWTSLGAANIYHAVMYDDTAATPVADPLMIHWPITTNSNGGNYTLQWSATGILTLS